MVILLLIGILVLSGCAAAQAPREEPAYDQSMGAAPAAPPAPEIASEAEGITSQSVANASAQDVERIVIKNGNLSIVVIDPPQSMDAISQMANGDFLTLSDVAADAQGVSGKHPLLGPVALNLAAVRSLSWERPLDSARPAKR